MLRSNYFNLSESAIVIFPGGEYGHLAIGHQGYDVAKQLNATDIQPECLK